MLKQDINNFKFYVVDSNYLQYLHEIDNEVYFDLDYINNNKLFLGILTNINNIDYFIPLTSPKRKHRNFNISDNTHKLIYDLVPKDSYRRNAIYKNHNQISKKQILSMLDIKKMIPVPKSCYEEIDINNISDYNYKRLCIKEYRFCKRIYTDIINSANFMYTSIMNGTNFRFAVNYNLCEEAMLEYEKNHSLDTVSNEEVLEME